LKSHDKPLKSSPDVPRTETKRRGGGKPFRSKLEPFFEEIKVARKARKTWAEIADQLKDRVATTPQGIHYFFKSKRRKKYALGMEPDEPAPAQPAAGAKPEPSPATSPEDLAEDINAKIDRNYEQRQSAPKMKIADWSTPEETNQKHE
jgi:hypothetical protein